MKLRRLLITLGLIAIAGAAAVLAGFTALYVHDMPPAHAPLGETIGPDEEFYMSEIIAGAVQLSNSGRQAVLKNDSSKVDRSAGRTAPGFNPKTYRRDVHSKTHGCVAARFEVRNVPERFRKGLFAHEGQYPAWIRYSNGKPFLDKDQAGDARGMAIKVMAVPGDKLLESEKMADTQDFIMINNPVFFIRTLQEYDNFSRKLATGSNYGYFFGGPSLDLSRWHMRELILGAKTQKKAPDSLLHERYWSLSSYTLGERQYVKYSARPCAANTDVRPNRSDPDFLRKQMQQELSRREACFDFMVQPQVEGKNMPVEDNTVNWSEEDSPFVPVARIQIVSQQFDTAEINQTCEKLSFNPWHALPEHRPVGVMNRARKSLYEAIARFRDCKNGGGFPGEPTASLADLQKLRFEHAAVCSGQSSEAAGAQ